MTRGPAASSTGARPEHRVSSRPRRHLLAAPVAAALLASPAVASGNVFRLTFQSAWPAKDIFHEFAHDFARKIADMSSQRLRIDMLPAGAVVRAFDLLDAVGGGLLDGAHGSLAYSATRSPALGLWGCGPAFGMDPNMLLAWHAYGGGRELLAEIYRELDIPVVSFVYGPMPTQPLGWFKKPITRPQDLVNLRMRTVGLAVDLFAEMGGDVLSVPAGEIVAAFERGTIDAAEFNNASSDRILGLPSVAKVCMLKSFHQSAENFEVLVNQAVFDGLPAEIRAIVQYAAEAASAEMSWKAIDRYTSDYIDMRLRQGVRFEPTPDSVLTAQLEAWDRVAERMANRHPAFARVQASMRTFAARAGGWRDATIVDHRMAWDHSFEPNRR
jgi:TRAP-type mannitol/chloroaromatic compound transport system substrate-binding protein